MKQFGLIALACTVVFAGTIVSAGETDSRIGHQVDNFVLKDFRGKSHSLADFKDRQIVVVAFLGTECPLAKLYGPRLQEMYKEYSSRGVAFIGVNSNVQDSITEIAAHARIHKIEFPILKDLGNKVADQMKAQRTPEVFVLDAGRTVRYWGRIDDQYGVGYVRDEPKREDLRAALEELLAGKPVSRPVSESVGCHIGRVRTPKADSEVTYSNQIARILQKRCVECHREGQIAPFALADYDEVVGWAEMIDEVVRDRRMPPWHADPKHGSFANDRHLSDAEKQLIYGWVANGAPEGDPKNLPEPPTFATTTWQLPKKPDLVVSVSPRPVRVRAEGEVRYQYFIVDPGFKEDKWVSAAELLPGNRAVVHHILAFSRLSGQRDTFGGGTRGYLFEYVPGFRAAAYPDGMAKRIPAGAKLVFQVHYTPIGSVQFDQSKLGLVFADPKDVKFEVVTRSAVQRSLNIPPNAANYRTTATSPRSAPNSQLLSLMPHMHLRGKAFRYEARYPDGKTEILLDIPAYDFNWQTAYRLEKPKDLPGGTRINCVAHFDNSGDNLSNPDPSKRVRWGEQTWDEMMIGYFDVAVPVSPASGAKSGSDDSDEDSPSRRRARELVDRYDKNGDGKVLRDEVPSALRRIFDRLDRDRNGETDVDEVSKSLKSYRG